MCYLLRHQTAHTLCTHTMHCYLLSQYECLHTCLKVATRPKDHRCLHLLSWEGIYFRTVVWFACVQSCKGGASQSNSSNNIILPFNVTAWLMKLREIWNPHVANHSRSQYEAAPRGIITRQPSLIEEDFLWCRLGQTNAAPFPRGLAATHMHVLIGYEMQ